MGIKKPVGSAKIDSPEETQSESDHQVTAGLPHSVSLALQSVRSQKTWAAACGETARLALLALVEDFASPGSLTDEQRKSALVLFSEASNAAFSLGQSSLGSSPGDTENLSDEDDDPTVSPEQEDL